MKVLMTPGYFYPEQYSSSVLVNDRTKYLAEKGIEQVVICPVPCRGIDDKKRKEYKTKRYEELFDGKVVIKRFKLFKESRNPILRAIRYYLLIKKQYRLAKKEKDIDVIFSSSTPPILGKMCAKLKKKLSKKYNREVGFVYNLQDIFPDSLVNANITKKGSLLWKIGRKIENTTYENADKIIVISEGFKRNIMEKGVPESKIELVSNWIDLESVCPIERNDNKLISEFGLDPSKFIVVYAGNFGEMQGADIVLKTAKSLQENSDIQFVIFGGGSRFNKAVEDAKELNNVFIHGLMPTERISEVYSLGNVALITCKKGTGKAGLPSKTWSIMACNTPIIAAFDIDSDLADILKDSGAGKCVEPGDSMALSDAILERYNDWKDNNNKHIDLRKYVETHAEKNLCVNKYYETIKSVLEKDN